MCNSSSENTAYLLNLLNSTLGNTLRIYSLSLKQGYLLKIEQLEHLLLSVRHVRDCIFIYEHDYISTAQCLVSVLSTSYLWSNFQHIKKSALSEIQLLGWLPEKIQMVRSEQF